MTTADRRVLRSGLPLLLSNALLIVVPVLGRHYLSVEDYAAWALLMTIVVSAFLLDFGGVSYVQTLGYGRTVPRGTHVKAVTMTAMGAVTITASAWMLWTGVRSHLEFPEPSQSMPLLILATGLATVLRGAWAVAMAALQIEERFGERSALALLQTGTQVVICWALLANGHRLWALPLSLAASCGLAWAVALALLVRRGDLLPDGDAHVPIRRFAGLRTIAAVLGILSSQSDRWVLSIVATPAFLADYDFANRFAALPLSAAITLLSGLIAESGAARDASTRHAVIKRAVKQMAVLLALGSLAVALLLAALGALNAADITDRVLVLFSIVVVWSGVSGLTGPITMAFVGMGRAGRELRYAVPSVMTSAAGWALAVALSEPWLVLASTFVAVVGWSAWFVRDGLRSLAHEEPHLRSGTGPSANT